MGVAGRKLIRMQGVAGSDDCSSVFLPDLQKILCPSCHFLHPVGCCFLQTVGRIQANRIFKVCLRKTHRAFVEGPWPNPLEDRTMTRTRFEPHEHPAIPYKELKRTLVAIGTHDLDTLHGPFTYEISSANFPKDYRVDILLARRKE